VQVVVLDAEAGHRAAQVGAAEDGRRRRLRQLEEVARVARPEPLGLAGLGEALGGVLPHRLEQVEARLAVGLLAPHQQALVAQRGDAVEHLRLAAGGVGRGDGLRGVEREAAAEHRQRAEQRLLAGREQRVAPVDGGAHGAVARVGVARLGAEQVDAPVEAGEQGARREHPRARRPRARAPAAARRGGGTPRPRRPRWPG
jgi:hypothetical protein